MKDDLTSAAKTSPQKEKAKKCSSVTVCGLTKHASSVMQCPLSPSFPLLPSVVSSFVRSFVRSPSLQAVQTRTMAAGSFYELSAKDIDGNDVSFEKFKGKVVLVTNVACK